MRQPNRSRAGFTLVELLIVMVVVSILAVVTWVQVEGMNARAYKTSMRSDLTAVALAQELYHQINMQYGAVSDLEAYKATDGVTVTVTHADGIGFAATATHSALPGTTCGYFTGTVPEGAGAPAEEPDVPVCD